jgi:hypothetical protein
MHELIDTIHAALTEDATAEAKQAGAQACRTILAVLDAEPGKTLADVPSPAPAVTSANPFAALAGLDLDHALDLVIARLRAAVPEEKQTTKPSAPGVRIQFVPVPKGR